MHNDGTANSPVTGDQGEPLSLLLELERHPDNTHSPSVTETGTAFALLGISGERSFEKLQEFEQYQRLKKILFIFFLRADTINYKKSNTSSV